MDPYYRFFLLKNPLFMISWNAVWGYDAFQRLLEKPDEADRVTTVRRRFGDRVREDGITHSVLDPLPAQVPYFCYLGYALGDHGILPLDGRFRLRWYPIDQVRAIWDKNSDKSKLALEKTVAHIRRKYNVTLKGPPIGTMP